MPFWLHVISLKFNVKCTVQFDYILKTATLFTLHISFANTFIWLKLLFFLFLSLLSFHRISIEGLSVNDWILMRLHTEPVQVILKYSYFCIRHCGFRHCGDACLCLYMCCLMKNRQTSQFLIVLTFYFIPMHTHIHLNCFMLVTRNIAIACNCFQSFPPPFRWVIQKWSWIFGLNNWNWNVRLTVCIIRCTHTSLYCMLCEYDAFRVYRIV